MFRSIVRKKYWFLECTNRKERRKKNQVNNVIKKGDVQKQIVNLNCWNTIINVEELLARKS